jgi:hypothetical protein
VWRRGNDDGVRRLDGTSARRPSKRTIRAVSLSRFTGEYSSLHLWHSSRAIQMVFPTSGARRNHFFRSRCHPAASGFPRSIQEVFRMFPLPHRRRLIYRKFPKSFQFEVQRAHSGNRDR